MTKTTLRVLAADDDPTMAILLRAVLAAPEFDLCLVADGDAALAACAEPGRFDIVLLDVEMPGRDGLQVAAELRRRDGTDLPIVLLTGREDAAFAAALAALPARHLAKPVNWTTLPDQLREWLRFSGNSG